jgi:hypothetical protein
VSEILELARGEAGALAGVVGEPREPEALPPAHRHESPRDRGERPAQRRPRPREGDEPSLGVEGIGPTRPRPPGEGMGSIATNRRSNHAKTHRDR